MAGDPGAVLVTGGGGGMGLACAGHFAPHYPLVLADVDEERLGAAAAKLEGAGPAVRTVVCDVSEAADVERLGAMLAEAGELAAIVHTAGLSSSMGTGRRIVEVSLQGTARVLEATLPLAGEDTVAVCVASISGHRRRSAEFDRLLLDPLRDDLVTELEAAGDGGELPGSVGYSLSKRGVIQLVEVEARRWGERGARIVSISPGVVDTPMGQRELGTNAAGLIALSAMGRIGHTDDIVAAVAYACSPEASFLTGCDIRLDGGTVPTFAHHSEQADREVWDDPWKAAARSAELAAQAAADNA